MRCASADRDGPGPLRVRTRPAYRYVSRHVRSALDAAFCNRQHYRHCVYPGLTPRVTLLQWSIEYAFVRAIRLTPFLSRGIAILGLAMSPGGLLRETRPNLATLSFFNADFWRKWFIRE